MTRLVSAVLALTFVALAAGSPERPYVEPDLDLRSRQAADSIVTAPFTQIYCHDGENARSFPSSLSCWRAVSAVFCNYDGLRRSIRTQFTAKHRDYESGLNLDYFGARYFAGAMGRFTSADPLLNSGRPWLPQSWNRYAYALNNPLRYTDPTGLYEWDKNCKQGDQACEQNRQQFRDALANVQKAASNAAKGSKERKQLEAIIAKIGTEGDGNKTRIAFNAKMADFGRTLGNKMTFNFQAVGQALSKWDAATVNTAKAALVGHEGQHLLDGGGMFSGLKYLMSRRERVRQEIGPFTIESYVFRSFNKLEPFGYGLGVSKGDTAGWPLWNPSWAAADAEKLRQTNVGKVVEELYNKKK